jgi:drug/metabolite transporter (DMT)-like permease
VERPLLLALAAIALWSTNAVTAKLVLADLPVSMVQCLQFTGAAIVFAWIQFGSRQRTAMAGKAARVGKANRVGKVALFAGIGAKALLLGLIGLTGTMVLQYLAFASMPVIEANLIAYTWPLLVAAGLILLKRTARPARLALLALAGFAGAALVITGGERTLTLVGESYGYAAAIGSAFCMAYYTLTIGSVSTAPERLLLPSALVGFAGTLIWSLADGLPDFSPEALIGGLYFGVGPMGLGYLLWSKAMRGDDSGRMAILGYLTPIGSTALLMLAGEQLTSIAAAGAVLVIGSCLAVGFQQRERKAHA